MKENTWFGWVSIVNKGLTAGHLFIGPFIRWFVEVSMGEEGPRVSLTVSMVRVNMG